MIFFNCLRGLLCLTLLSCHITEADAGFSSLYSNFKSFLFNTTTCLSEFVSEIYIPVPSLNAFTTLYFESLNRVKFLANKVANVSHDWMCAVNRSDTFLKSFSRNSTFWHDWPFIFHDNCALLFNATAFDLEVKQKVFGQHIAINIVTAHLKMHLSEDNPKKSLVMSFFGETGTGKSFLSKIIANNLFKDGARSDCVHFYHGSLDFSNENKKIAYQKKLLNEVSLFIYNCERALFIFDEIDKMVPEVIDILEPYLQFSEKPSYMDFRKSTFIFIGNSGGKKITEIAYYAWLDGIQREDLTLGNFSAHLEEAAYHTEGGLWQSKIVKKNLIDVFVPFLPLEKKHVKQCIVKELQQQKLPDHEDIVEKIANQLQYDRPDFEVYSVSGCKRVSHKIDLYSDNES